MANNNDIDVKKYNELLARDNARRERARLQGARNRARMAFYKKYFNANATADDKKQLAQIVSSI